MMVDPAIQEHILEQLIKLPADQQCRVLEFVRALAAGEPVGVSGRELLRFAGMIDPADLKEMERVIEQECERVDPDEW
jgi:hypothetical protein